MVNSGELFELWARSEYDVDFVGVFQVGRFIETTVE